LGQNHGSEPKARLGVEESWTLAGLLVLSLWSSWGMSKDWEPARRGLRSPPKRSWCSVWCLRRLRDVEWRASTFKRAINIKQQI
jgi:hypothetical protein